MSFRNEDEIHVVNFQWNSPQNGTLYVNRIVWNGHGDPIVLSGFSIENNNFSPFYLEVVENTPNWKSLSKRLSKYQQHYKESAIKEHVFGELCDYMR